MKPGYKTSEFSVTISAIGGILWAYIQQNCDISPTKLITLVIGIGGAAGIYTGGRIYLKSKQPQSGGDVSGQQQ